MTLIYVLGTKAQFIKCKFILKYLHDAGYNLLILDTGQHKEITSKELENVEFSYEFVSLSNNSKNISRIIGMFFWFFKIVLNYKMLNLKNVSYCMVHGDTLSTLIGLIFGKRNRLKIIHLESGYRSNNLLKPFPEEIVKNIVSKYSDILVVDGDEQLNNVKKYIDNKKIIKISRNTIYDSVLNIENIGIDKENKLIVTIHRTENIYKKKRLESLVNLLVDIKNTNKFEKIIWYCHDITSNALKRNNYEQYLLENKIILKELVPHKIFMSEILSSALVITDGGSIAEECSILDQKTIIWRDVVENKKYLTKNVILSNYDSKKIFKFINNIDKERNNLTKSESPSLQFVEEFQKIANS